MSLYVVFTEELELVDIKVNRWELIEEAPCFAGQGQYYVKARNIKANLLVTWGPFKTTEEAYRVSGMPKPKTEAEEVWELLDRSQSLLCNPFSIRSASTVDLAAKVEELKAKWKK